MWLIFDIAIGGLDEGNHVYGRAGLRLYPSPKIFIALLYLKKYKSAMKITFIFKKIQLFFLKKLPVNDKSEMSKMHFKVKSQLNNISYLNMYIKL